MGARLGCCFHTGSLRVTLKCPFMGSGATLRALSPPLELGGSRQPAHGPSPSLHPAVLPLTTREETKGKGTRRGGVGESWQEGRLGNKPDLPASRGLVGSVFGHPYPNAPSSLHSQVPEPVCMASLRELFWAAQSLVGGEGVGSVLWCRHTDTLRHCHIDTHRHTQIVTQS